MGLARRRRASAMLRSLRRQQRGVALLEFHIVALYALLPLCLGIVQIGLLLADNHHVDYAAFMAARHGAVSHGDLTAMRRSFAAGITPLYVDSSSAVNRSSVATKVSGAIALAATDVALHARLRVLAPNPAAQQDFAIQRDGRRVIPNDALDYRAITPGARSGLSLQEANLLQLEVSFCRPLIVPFAGPLLVTLLRALDPDPWHQQCYRAGRVPLRSVGTASMQSDFRVTS
jgi:Flp pilus assembly protein TadG